MAEQLLQIKTFSSINLDDPFFDSLKADYKEFANWFTKKGDQKAFVFEKAAGTGLEGFMYLKIEDGAVEDLLPPLPPAHRLKIGTFKINPHGTRLGERFLKRAFDYAIEAKATSMYVTAFKKHAALIVLFEKYGFKEVATKVTGNGSEAVYARSLIQTVGDVVLDYPRIPLQKDRHFVLSLYPEYHSKLLPDSLLKTEDASILTDVSHTNSIHKIYLTRMEGVEQLVRGDTLLIYRTKDAGPAYFTSVVTSVGVVEELLHISSFQTEQEFLNYCEPYSIFSVDELQRFYRTRRYQWLIRFTYNLALKKRINRQALIEEVGLAADQYWGFFRVTTEQLRKLFELSKDYEKANSLVYTP